MLTFVAAAVAAAASTGETRLWRWSGVERVVAVGDVHGAFDELVTILEESELVDEELRWIGGASHLVMLGDIADRGPRPRDCYDLVIRLQEEADDAGGRLHFLLGNHEIMNLVGDLRYVADEDFASYAGHEDDAEIERQLARAQVFDWLILNPDRPDDDLLYTADWQVHLIDHSQAFVPPTRGHRGARLRVPNMDGDLKARVDSLDDDELTAAVEDLLEAAELEALLARFKKAKHR